MLFTELQLRKPILIGAMFNVARRVALAEESTQDITARRKEKMTEQYPKERFAGLNFEQRKLDKGKGSKKTYAPPNVSKEKLISIIKNRFRVQNPIPMNPHSSHLTPQGQIKVLQLPQGCEPHDRELHPSQEDH